MTEIERFEDIGDFQHYRITMGKVMGEVWAVRGFAESGINEMLIELRRHLTNQRLRN